jgi:hypothetical protein
MKIYLIFKGYLKANGNLCSSVFLSVISKPDNPAIFDAKVEALYQMGLIEPLIIEII